MVARNCHGLATDSAELRNALYDSHAIFIVDRNCMTRRWSATNELAIQPQQCGITEDRIESQKFSAGRDRYPICRIPMKEEHLSAPWSPPVRGQSSTTVLSGLSYRCRRQFDVVECLEYQERACSQRSGNRAREKVTVPASRTWRDAA